MKSKYHHILFTRNTWESHPATRWLRNSGRLIIPMDAEVEAELHIVVPTVPLLDQYTAQHTQQYYKPTNDPMDNIYGLMRSIERASKHSKANELQVNLANLTIHAIQLQIPFIREGALNENV